MTTAYTIYCNHKHDFSTTTKPPNVFGNDFIYLITDSIKSGLQDLERFTSIFVWILNEADKFFNLMTVIST